MSMHLFGVEGYGINADAIEQADDIHIIELLNLCPETLRNAIQERNDSGDIKKVIEEYDFDCAWGVSALFVEAIYEQENILLTDARVEDDHCILFTPLYPWMQVTKEEKELTREKLDAIFDKYLDVLGIPKDKRDKADYCNLVGSC